MKVELTAEGVTVEATDLGPLLGLKPAEVPGAMRRGEITSLYERGEGEDAGRFRVTFRHGSVKLRLTCAEDGTVISRVRTSGG
jgi:hypothetical protein